MARADLSSTKNASKAAASRRHHHHSRRHPDGLEIEPIFCPTDVADPFDTVEWETRTAAIKGEAGGMLFEQNDCEVPAGWSQLATNVVVSKYFYGEIGTPRAREERPATDSPRQPHDRRLGHWTTAISPPPSDGENFYRDLTWLCLHQHGAFNSPVWFNVGLFHQYGVQGAAVQLALGRQASESVAQPENPYEYPQGSACFIQSVKDNMEDIMELARSEAMLFKFGSGTGTDLSHAPLAPREALRRRQAVGPAVVHAGLRPDRGGGQERRQDPPRRQDAVAQGLASRRDGVHRVQGQGREEGPHADREGGYEANFNGEAYSSILFQNANLSVRVSDEFMQAVVDDQPWTTHWVTDPGARRPEWPAREVLARMAEGAWACGDPGVQYDTTINRWHTCPNSGRINASNPCSEYMFLDDTACNLASINLMKFRRDDGTFDVERFQAACRMFFIAQEILVDHASYPTKRIADNSHRFRPLGLGYSNLGSLVMASGLPYDSRRGPRLVRGDDGPAARGRESDQRRAGRRGRAVRRAMNAIASRCCASCRCIATRSSEIDDACPDYLKDAARDVWDEVLDARPQARLPQRPGDGARADRHDQLPDGLRHDRASSPTSPW